MSDPAVELPAPIMSDAVFTRRREHLLAELERSAADLPPSVGPARRPRRRLLPRRSLVLACAVAAAVVPLTALAATNHWWFLSGSGLPRPGQSPIVARRGSWDGHRWSLVAYPSKHLVSVGPINGTTVNGLCWGVVFAGAPRRLGGESADAFGCGSLVGIQRPRLVANLKQSGSPIPTAVIYWNSGYSPGYPRWKRYIDGVIISSATHVVIRWPARKAEPGILASPAQVVRTATFAAPIKGYRVRLFATRIPQALSHQNRFCSRHSKQVRRCASDSPLPSTISGTNPQGHVVACDSVGGLLPLSSCKP
jgi:hypothetical protein